MNILKVENKKDYMPLLLLADEQENMIDLYILDGDMYMLDDNGIVGEIVVLQVSNDVLEIKNLAVLPEFQRHGYGRALIDFVCEKYKNEYGELQVGTGDSPLTIPFYEKCGFSRSHVVKDFFTKYYDHPIFEVGVRLVDMVYLKKIL